MKDLCHDVFGVLKEKKDPKEVKGHRGNNWLSSSDSSSRQSPMLLLICKSKQQFFILCYLGTELLDVFPEKRGYEEGGYTSDEEEEVQLQLFSYACIKQ